MKSWKLFYDGGCNLCHQSQLRVERWAARAGQPLEVEVLQSEEAVSKGYGDDIVLEVDGKALTGGDAWLEAITVAPWYLRWLSVLGRTEPSRAFTRRVYRVVARNRHRFFGRRACPMPDKPRV